MNILKKKGFTLIELMVVIVIIGVLASLAIPRFSSAADKAKAAEAPRVLASFESAFLAGVAEYGHDGTSLGGANSADAEIMFDVPGGNGTTKFFTYTPSTTTDLKVGKLQAQTIVKLGGWTGSLGTEYTALTNGDGFERCADEDDDFKKLLPNYVGTGDEYKSSC